MIDRLFLSEVPTTIEYEAAQKLNEIIDYLNEKREIEVEIQDAAGQIRVCKGNIK